MKRRCRVGRPGVWASIAVCALVSLRPQVVDAQIVANGKTLTVTTTNAVATFNGPDLVGFGNSLTSETYLKRPSNASPTSDTVTNVTVPGGFTGQTLTVNQTAAPATTLNLSQDLVALGIAASNMTPNQPSLDAGPLLSSGVGYAMAHGMSRVIADPGAYYFLSLQNPSVHVQLGGNPATPSVSDLTIDFQGSALVFTHPLQYGIVLWMNTNVVVQNFTTDYQPLPFTQLRVLAVDTAQAQIQYTVESGYQDPAAFNSAVPSPGTGPIVIEVHIFRNGRPAFDTRRMAAQFPFGGNRVTIIPGNGFDPTPANMSAIRPGDIAVVAIRQFGEAIAAYRCSGCTFRNITVYSAAGAAIDLTHSDNTVWERVYSVPKPSTDRLISSFGFGFQAKGPNNQVRLSRAIRTIDGGFAMYTWATGAVESQQPPRTVTVSGGCCALGQGVTIPNGSHVVFQRRSDGVILDSATLVSQTGSVSAYNPDHLSYTFDHDLPGNLVGAVMYTTDIDQRGGNSIVERNTVQDKSCCFGMDIWGWAGSTVRGNYIRRVGYAGIGGIQSLVTTSWTTPPLVDMTFSRNVIDGTKMTTDWWLQEMGGIQMAGIGPDVNGNPDLMLATAHQNITITNNFIADPGRAAVWLADTLGGSVTGNLFLHPNERRELAGDHPPQTNVNAPLIIDTTSSGIATANNTVDQTSGILFVTDSQYRELAAYAPGGTIRLHAYGIGALGAPAVTLTDADGIMRPVTIQATAAHALDVQVPAAAALGGAYLTLTSGGTKYFGTLFLDSQDNVPALNGCIYEASLSSTSVPGTGGSLAALVVTQPGCGYQVLSPDAWVTPGAGSGTGVITVAFAANTGTARKTTIEIAGQPFTITESAGVPPTMTLDRSSLIFTAVNSGTAFTAVTAPQTIRMTQTGAGTVMWTAQSNQPWLVVSPASGTGTATLTISTTFAAGLAAAQAGAITISLTGAGNGVGPISITLQSISPSGSKAPFGAFDTPTDGLTNVTGSIAVTGWALDDVQVTRVTICRDAVTGESSPFDGNCAGNANIYVGDAIFVEGARTDVQGLFPNTPVNSRAGWGYLLLSNFLPNLGNSTVRLRAYAFDADGHSVLLGTKTITCNNSAATTPFGAIDSPAQGAVVSGTMANLGWVLTQKPKDIPADSSTVTVFIDGTNVGRLQPGRSARADIDFLFSPTYDTSHAAGGQFVDTTTYPNGVHTIFWIAVDSANQGGGIGSRFFTISNGSGLIADPASIPIAAKMDVPREALLRTSSPASLMSEVDAAPPDDAPIRVRRGFDLERPLQDVTASEGRFDIQSEELDRIELRLSDRTGLHYYGYVRTVSGLTPLPVGSTLDRSTGVFTWAPGVGFVGGYDLVFVRWSGGTPVARQDVHIVLNPKGSTPVAPVIR